MIIPDRCALSAQLWKNLMAGFMNCVFSFSFWMSKCDLIIYFLDYATIFPGPLVMGPPRRVMIRDPLLIGALPTHDSSIEIAMLMA